MSLQIVSAQSEHIDGLAEANIAAFQDFADRTGSHMGFPETVEDARRMYSLLIDWEYAYPFAALVDGEVSGSAWLRLGDEVAAFEDVNVAPAFQGRGIAKAVMRHGIEYARGQGYDKIRLTQSGHNATALSLYASVGFEVKEAIAEMRAREFSAQTKGKVRQIRDTDLPAVEALSKGHYKVNRAREVSEALKEGLVVLGLEHNGELTGYLTLQTNEHGVAQSEDDMLALIAEASRQMSNGAEFNCPLSQGSLYRKLLSKGCRTIEIHTLMAIGPYEQPEGVWMPSGAY